MSFQPMLEDLLGKAARRLALPPMGERDLPGPLREPAAKLGVLRKLGEETEALMRRAPARRTALPFAAVPRACRFLEMAESEVSR